MLNFLKTKVGKTVVLAILAALGVVASAYCQPCLVVVDGLKDVLVQEQPVE